MTANHFPKYASLYASMFYILFVFLVWILDSKVYECNPGAAPADNSNLLAVLAALPCKDNIRDN